MDLSDYCISVPEQKTKIKSIYTLDKNTDHSAEDSSDDSEEINIKYIIKNKPPSNVVKEFFEYLLEDDDDLPDFLKK